MYSIQFFVLNHFDIFILFTWVFLKNIFFYLRLLQFSWKHHNPIIYKKAWWLTIIYNGPLQTTRQMLLGFPNLYDNSEKNRKTRKPVCSLKMTSQRKVINNKIITGKTQRVNAEGNVVKRQHFKAVNRTWEIRVQALVSSLLARMPCIT